MGINWTRDEVILGLDVLSFSNDKRFSMDSPEIKNLSKTLLQLPIIPQEKRPSTFRNPAGVRRQLLTFEWSLKKNIKDSHVGEIFYIVFNEYKDRLDELNRIAQAIRNCIPFASNILFGDEAETDGFQEGAILSHVHRYAETQFQKKSPEDLEECEICGLHPQNIYVGKNSRQFLDLHLLVNPVDYEPEMKLSAADFITVCPNCHRALHLTRPWITREHCEGILLRFDQR